MRIIYFDIDSLRPDHLGCYGYRRPTSPNIDAIAAQAVFRHHLSAIAFLTSGAPHVFRRTC